MKYDEDDDDDDDDDNEDDDNDNRRVGAAATARSLVDGWCCARTLVCVCTAVSSFLHDSAALATVTGASRSRSFVLCLLLAFSFTRARNECLGDVRERPRTLPRDE